MEKIANLTTVFLKSQNGKRLDQALVELFPQYSRSCIKQWILNDCVTINGIFANKPNIKVLGDELVTIQLLCKKQVSWEPQDIPLNIIYEDDDILVINKPQGLVVHPGAGHPDKTLLNALLNYSPSIRNLPRAGIVHRLDKDTTGLMVVSKTITAQINLIESLQQHKFTREYEAIVVGCMTGGGKVDQPISRHLTKRTCMAVAINGKPAITHYRILEHYRNHTRLRVRLETGRTHQIRVHMSYMNHPILGDKIYGGFLRSSNSILKNFNRQALHAIMLSIIHPITGINITWHAPLPNDMLNLVNKLKTDTKKI